MYRRASLYGVMTVCLLLSFYGGYFFFVMHISINGIQGVYHLTCAHLRTDAVTLLPGMGMFTAFEAFSRYAPIA